MFIFENTSLPVLSNISILIFILLIPLEQVILTIN
jgi:hypothetical protein